MGTPSGGGGLGPISPYPGSLSSDRITIRTSSASRIPADGDLPAGQWGRARREGSGCARAAPRRRLTHCGPLGLPSDDSGSAGPAGTNPGASTASKMQAKRWTRWHRSTPLPLAAARKKGSLGTEEVMANKRNYPSKPARHNRVWVRIP